MKNSRREFLKKSAVIAAAPAIVMENSQTKKNNQFIHHVFFWLNENNKENRDKLIEGLRKLTKVKEIKSYHIGVPTKSDRTDGVVVSDYSISWTTFYANAEAEKKYQVDPIHLQFVEDYKHLWTKVAVYDTEAVIF